MSVFRSHLDWNFQCFLFSLSIQPHQDTVGFLCALTLISLLATSTISSSNHRTPHLAAPVQKTF